MVEPSHQMKSKEILQMAADYGILDMQNVTDVLECMRRYDTSQFINAITRSKSYSRITSTPSGYGPDLSVIITSASSGL